MKKELFSVGILVVGGCFWSAITGFSRGDHQDEGAAQPQVFEELAGEVTLSAEIREELGLEIGPVELRTFSGSAESVMAVPIGAVVEGAKGRPFVFFKEDASGEADTFQRRTVELGARDTEFVEIGSGLFPGDTIVVKHADRISANVRVVDTVKGGEEKRAGGFVERSKEIAVAEVEVVGAKVPEGAVRVAKVEKNESAVDCPYCGMESISANGFCQNGFCEELPRGCDRTLCPQGAPRARVYRIYGAGAGYCEPSFGAGYGPGPCRW